MKLTSGWPAMVTAKTVPPDALAGLLGALLALPQAVAFATLAGLPPQYGIFTAVVPTIVAAVFGSSLHVVSGPTNANSLAMIAAIGPLAVASGTDYVTMVLAVTIMVGLVQFAVGAFRLGWLTDFLSPSVLLGFMSGAATLIACYALPDLLGVHPKNPHGPFGEVAAVARRWREVEGAAVAVAVITFAATLAARRILPRGPFMLIGLAVGWAVAEAITRRFGAVGIDTLGSVPAGLPAFRLPQPPLAALSDLAPAAIALAVVALGQSVSIAKAMAARSGQRIDVDREFAGQGLSNIVGGLFSCYLSCGSLNRSLPNLESGAKTPLSAIFSALFMLVFVAFAAPLLGALPKAAIAALLAYTAWSLLDVRRFVELAKLSRIEFAVAAATFAAMLVASFHFAILVGSGLSLIVYLRRTSRPRVRTLAPDPATEMGRFTPVEELDRPKECPQLKLLRMEGSAYYGATQHVGGLLHDIRARSPGQKRLLVMAKSMNFVDLAGSELWELELRRRRSVSGDLYFHCPRSEVLDTWQKTGFLERLGRDHIFGSKREAVASIFKQLDPEICARCEVRIFRECGPKPAAPLRAD